MKFKKFSVFLAAFALVIGLVQAGSVALGSGKRSSLATALPESDGVVVMDAKRLIYDALPQLLSAGSSMRAKIDREIDKMKADTGLDLRDFDEVVVGLKYKGKSASTDFDAVVLARGNVDMSSLEDVAKTASKGDYRKVEIGGRTAYVFSPKEILKDKQKHIKGTVVGDLQNKMFGGMSGDVALAEYDSNTVVFGSIERVKETFSNSPRISNELLGLLDRKPGALANMGMFIPAGMSQFFELDDDELGANLDSIRQMQASLDVVNGVMSISVAAKSADAERAEELAVTLQGIRRLFAGILKGNKAPDKQVYGRLLENLEVSHADREIFVDISVPKSDLDIIIGNK